MTKEQRQPPESARTTETMFEGLRIILRGDHLGFTHEGFSEQSPFVQEQNLLRRFPYHGLVVYLNNRPRLRIVYGIREKGGEELQLNAKHEYERTYVYHGNSPYIHVVKLDPTDNSIYVEGRSERHLFDNRDGEGFDLEEIANNQIDPSLSITQEGDVLIIEATWEGSEKEKAKRKNKYHPEE